MTFFVSRHGAWRDAGGIAAFAFALLQISTYSLPAGERLDWLNYQGLAAYCGVAMLATLLWRAGLLRRLESFAPAWKVISTLGSIYLLLALSWHVLPEIAGWPYAPMWIVAGGLAWYWKKTQGLAKGDCIAVALAVLLVLALAWRLLTQNGIFTTWMMAGLTRFHMAMLAVSYALVMAGIWGTRRNADCATLYRWVAWGVAALVMVRVGFCIDTGRGSPLLVSPGSMYHWRNLIEPAVSVRDGGWLLWDTPAQYGFFQILTLAVFPAATVWQSMYLVNGSLIALSGMMIFSLLFLRRPTIAGFAMGLVVAVGSVMVLLSPWGSYQRFPSGGPIRFVWLYVFEAYGLALLYYAERGGRLQRWHLRVGHGVWLLSMLWSVESMVSGTVVWVPMMLLLSIAELAQRCEKPPGVMTCAKAIGAQLRGMAELALLAVSLIMGYYWVRIGGLPEIRYFYEYAVVFKAGFFAIPINTGGAVGAWLCVFAGIALSCRAALMQSSVTARWLTALAAYYAAFAGFWAVGSYFVSRSHENNMINILPVLVCMSAAVLLLNDRSSLPLWVRESYKTVMLGFYSVIAFGGLADINNQMSWKLWFQEPLIMGDITEYLPKPTPEVQALFAKAGVKPHDRMLILGTFSGEMASIYIPELELLPWLLPNAENSYDLPLPKEFYVSAADRWVERRGSAEGWLLTRLSDPLSNYFNINQVIMREYQPWVAWENKTYRLQKFIKLP